MTGRDQEAADLMANRAKLADPSPPTPTKHTNREPMTRTRDTAKRAETTYGNRRRRAERLVSAWNQGANDATESEDGADDPLIGMSEEPSKRPRTRLTDKEVDAMRTARAQGVSVNSIAKRFGITRQTVWEKTR